MADRQPQEDKHLFFDQPTRQIQHLKFNDSNPLQPDPNDFEVIEISYLSNERGERWALMTFKNSSSGQRLLNSDNIVAIFADGSRKEAQNVEEKLQGGELLTRTVFFGQHTFPIVSVIVSSH